MAGVLLIAWIPFAIGRYKADQLREDLAKRRQLLALLSELSRILRLTRRPPEEILLVAAQGCDCSLLIGGKETLSCDSIVSHIRDPRIVSRVASLFRALRSTDAVGADQSLKETVDWLSESVSEAQATCDRKAPLFVKLGALITMFVFVILL